MVKLRTELTNSDSGRSAAFLHRQALFAEQSAHAGLPTLLPRRNSKIPPSSAGTNFFSSAKFFHCTGCVVGLDLSAFALLYPTITPSPHGPTFPAFIGCQIGYFANLLGSLVL